MVQKQINWKMAIIAGIAGTILFDLLGLVLTGQWWDIPPCWEKKPVWEWPMAYLVISLMGFYWPSYMPASHLPYLALPGSGQSSLSKLKTFKPNNQ